jgi:hypothetical protein
MVRGRDEDEDRLIGATGRCAASAWVVLALLMLAGSWAVCADWPQFRGQERDGKSGDTGLLKKWPAQGPKLLWSIEDLGFGYASAVVVGGTVYTTGLEGKEGYLYALDLDGKRKWRMPYGPDWSGGLSGTRTTPTISDGLAYIMTAYGRAVCLDAKTGERKWAVDTRERFGAKMLNWGIAESPLIDGDNVICTPGGAKAGVVALNKKTGETVWACGELSDKSAYCSPILVKRGGLRIIVTLTAGSLVGIDAATGKILWRHGRSPAHGIHAVSPVYEGGRIYVTSGYGGVRGEMLELSEDGRSITKKWTENKLDCQHGGVIVHKGHVYGASDRNRPGKWICLNLKTGQVAAEAAAVGKGSSTYADGMFYGYGENGTVGLINASPTDFRLISSFTVTKGAQQHWAHPTVVGGRLYIRHGTVLMAYDVKAR